MHRIPSNVFGDKTPYFVAEEKKKSEKPKIPDISRKILSIAQAPPKKRILVKIQPKTDRQSDVKSDIFSLKRKTPDEGELRKRRKSEEEKLFENFKSISLSSQDPIPTTRPVNEEDESLTNEEAAFDLVNSLQFSEEHTPDIEDLYEKIRGLRVIGNHSPLETECCSPPLTPRMRPLENMDE